MWTGGTRSEGRCRFSEEHRKPRDGGASLSPRPIQNLRTTAIQAGAVGRIQSCGLAKEENKAEILARIVLDAYPSYCEVRAVADGVLDRR